MLQGGCGLCFTPEAFQCRGNRGAFRQAGISNHAAMEPSVQLFRDVVGRNGLANK
jgi:hypothetical protein